MQNYSPLVSIVIPVYNGANYVKEAIDSALNQTYSNLEVIVVNDGSNDQGETETIAKSYGEQIRYFSKPNGGVASALNLAIQEMKGEFFSWLSHDDVYYPFKIEHQVNILNSLENRDTIIYCGYELIDNKSKSLGFMRPERQFSLNKLNIPLMPLLRGLIHGCSLLIPAKCFHEIGMFNENLLFTQDYDLWSKFLRKFPIYFDNHILIKSRVHEQQDSRNKSSEKAARRDEESNQLWIGFLKNLDEIEMTAIDDSPYLFLSRSASFLTEVSYNEAAAFANSMLRDILSDIKVSVIIPVYNRIVWAIEAIDSVLAQAHSNFELIIIDDGSTEDISSILAKCNKDERIVYIRQENKGAAAARNLGIRKASGKYIAFLDADDLFYPNKLQTQLRFMEEKNAYISYTAYTQINIKGDTIGKAYMGISPDSHTLPKIITNCSIATPTVMAETNILKSNPFPEYMKVGEDICLWIQIAVHYKIDAINSELTKVRIHKENAAYSAQKQAEGLVNIASFVIGHKYLNRFSAQTVSLLAIAVQRLEQIKPFKITVSFNSILSLMRGVIYSLRMDGIRLTLKRIYRRLK